MTHPYSVSIADLTRQPLLAALLIEPVTKGRQIREITTREIDGHGALVLECDDDRAQAIIATIRIKHRKNTLRCWKNTRCI